MSVHGETGRRWAAVAACVVGLVALGQLSLGEAARAPQLGLRADIHGEELFIRWVQPAGLAWDAGIRPGDRVVALDGRPLAPRVVPEAVAAARAVQVGEASGATVTASVADVRAVAAGRRAGFLLLAACFVAVGGAVFVLGRDRAATIFLGFAMTWAATLLVALASPFGATWALATVFAALLCGGAATLLLFLAFPVDRLDAPSGRWAAIGCVGFTAALLALYGWCVAFAPAAYAIVQPTAYAALIAELGGASALIVIDLARHSPRHRAARQALVLVALGTVVGLLPFGLLALLPRLLGQQSLVAPDVAILSIGFLPLSLGAAIVSQRSMGITRLVRRGLVALLVWIALFGGYSLGLEALTGSVDRRSDRLAAVLGSTAFGVAVIAGTFPFAQARLRRALEERLFHDTYDYAATLRRIGAEIARLTSVGSIADHALTRLGVTLDLAWATIALADKASPPLNFRWDSCPSIELSPYSGGGALPTYKAPLVVDGQTIGLLAVGPKRHDVDLLPEDCELVATLAPLIAAALHNGLLVRRLEAQVATLGERERELEALSARLLQVQEEERRQLALDLHDDPLQRATLLARALDGAADRRVNEADRQALEEIVGALRAICVGLRPPVLDDLGLVVGLESLIDDVRARVDIEIDLVTDVAIIPGAALDTSLAIALYRVAQEALNNVLKHAQATRVTVALCWDERHIALQVIDNGQGIDGIPSQGGYPSLALGILGMRERLRPWDGSVRVTPGRDGGTVVTAEVAL